MRSIRTTVAAASGSQSILGDNSSRGSVMIENRTDGVANISLAATATSTNTNFTLEPRERETVAGYTGQAAALFGTNPEGGYSGSLVITEIAD